MDLSSLSLTELRRLQSKVETEIRRRSDSTRKDLLKKMQRMAADQGLSLNDIVGSAASAGAEKKAKEPAKARRTAKASAKKGSRVPAKYRNPADASATWTGRGRKPLWVEKWIADGRSVDELLIQQG